MTFAFFLFHFLFFQRPKEIFAVASLLVLDKLYILNYKFIGYVFSLLIVVKFCQRKSYKNLEYSITNISRRRGVWVWGGVSFPQTSREKSVTTLNCFGKS